MIYFGSQLSIWLMFLLQLGGFLLVIYMFALMIRWGLGMLWSSMRNLIDKR